MMDQKRLERRLRALERELTEAKQASQKQSRFSRFGRKFKFIPQAVAQSISRKSTVPRLAVIGSGMTIIAVCAVALALTDTPKHRIGQSSGLPPSVISQVQGFRVYYLKPSYQTDFTLNTATVNYRGGVLLFEMTGASDTTLVVTEQATPPNFDISSITADKQSSTQYGKSFITDAAARTTGALITTDHTWILVNAPKPIGGDLMQEIVNNLVPR
jgi:hypothetical protein